MADESVIPDRLCPGCQKALKNTMRPHCLGYRKKPCGWVVCSKCQTMVDGHGHHYPPASPQKVQD
jgi:endogenous inhibitor of DNA gyrase (YacG/DUF329 family)